MFKGGCQIIDLKEERLTGGNFTLSEKTKNLLRSLASQKGHCKPVIMTGIFYESTTTKSFITCHALVKHTKSPTINLIRVVYDEPNTYKLMIEYINNNGVETFTGEFTEY